jgi:uncharacterized damage-inducible protein DinB
MSTGKSMKQYFTELFKYQGWANKKVISGLYAAGLSDPEIMKLLSHILLAEETWLQRLKSAKYDNKFWIELSLDECSNLANRNIIEMNGYLSSLSDKDFNSIVKYSNSKGIEYSNSIKEILTHLSHHSSYHRGQIARAMRKIGKEPIYTDYIAFLR